MLAPVSYIPNYGMVISPDAPLLYAQFQAAQQNFTQKPKGKKGSPAAESHRAGDWVCIMCHNLNYSFRKVCNRCQVQTKRDNLIQSLCMLNKNGRSEDQAECKEEIAAPPGLGKTIEGRYRRENEHFGSSSRREETPTNKSLVETGTPDLRTPSTAEFYSSKGNLLDGEFLRVTSHSKWHEYVKSKKDKEKLKEDSINTDNVTIKPFKLFDDSNNTYKDSMESPQMHGKSTTKAKKAHRMVNDDSQHDSNVMRSLDYVFEDGQE